MTSWNTTIWRRTKLTLASNDIITLLVHTRVKSTNNANDMYWQGTLESSSIYGCMCTGDGHVRLFTQTVRPHRSWSRSFCQVSVAMHKKLPLFFRFHPESLVCVRTGDSGSVQGRIGTFWRCQNWINTERFIAICHPSYILGGWMLPEHNNPVSMVAGLPADHLINMGYIWKKSFRCVSV